MASYVALCKEKGEGQISKLASARRAYRAVLKSAYGRLCTERELFNDDSYMTIRFP